MGYTTLTDQYYRRVSPQTLLDGARVGIIAYLYSRGIVDPPIGILHIRPDGRGVVPQIERQLGKAIARYGTRMEARQFVYAAIRGELGALRDPYSVFFTKAELSGFTTALDGRSFGGIGVVLATDADAGFHVESVFAGGPAERAGLQPGDRILSVDGRPIAGLSTVAVGHLLRGQTGSIVRLALVRAGAAPFELSVTRAAIVPPEVTARLLPDDVGYLSLRSFGPAAGEQVHTALVHLHAQGARGLVFDLRGNGGGYESSAVHVASAFVPAGPIVATQTNRGPRRMTNADGSALAPIPLVVLVDGDSASGSELVTAAIADHGLGKIVGTRTFGKGLVQTLFPLPDGSALKVTTARYFTPNGHDIDRVGILPDVVVAEPADAQRGVPGHDAQLDAAVALLRPPSR